MRGGALGGLLVEGQGSDRRARVATHKSSGRVYLLHAAQHTATAAQDAQLMAEAHISILNLTSHDRDILLVQSLARRRAAIAKARQLRSARRVQSAWRGLQGRRALTHARSAAVALQAAARRAACRRALSEQRRARLPSKLSCKHARRRIHSDGCHKWVERAQLRIWHRHPTEQRSLHCH